MRRAFLLPLFALSSTLYALRSTLYAQKAQKPQTPPPTKPPLVNVDITKLPEGATHLDLWLLCGQSNMKGRGVMPEEPKQNPRIVMMHKVDDSW